MDAPRPRTCGFGRVPRLQPRLILQPWKFPLVVGCEISTCRVCVQSRSAVKDIAVGHSRRHMSIPREQLNLLPTCQRAETRNGHVHRGPAGMGISPRRRRGMDMSRARGQDWARSPHVHRTSPGMSMSPTRMSMSPRVVQQWTQCPEPMERHHSPANEHVPKEGAEEWTCPTRQGRTGHDAHMPTRQVQNEAAPTRMSMSPRGGLEE